MLKNSLFQPSLSFCFSTFLPFSASAAAFLFSLFRLPFFSLRRSLFLFFLFFFFFFLFSAAHLFFFSVSCFPRCCSAPALFFFSFCVLPFIFQPKILLFPTLLFLSTHSFWYFELNLNWRIFFPTSTILKFEPIF